MENQYSESGDKMSHDPNLFLDNQWAYNLVASIDHCLPDSQDGNCVDLTDHQVGKEQTSHQNQQTKKGKGVSRRGGSFTKEEDYVICSAFLNVRKDPIVGVNQSSGGYYKRMHEYFQAHKPEGSNRSQLAIQGRWTTIQKSLNKFCGIKSKIDHLQESGKNEQDRIEDAIKVYEQKEPFSFLHCWRILRDEPKWNDRLLELNNAATVFRVRATTSQCRKRHATTMVFRKDRRGVTKPRKVGRKGLLKTRHLSTAVDVLQQMTSNREKRVIKQDEQMAEILYRKDEKIRIQREMLETQKKKLQLREKEQEIRQMESEAQLLTAEAGIMCIDVDKLAPHIQDYYIGMQKRIMERRGFKPSSDN